MHTHTHTSGVTEWKDGTLMTFKLTSGVKKDDGIQHYYFDTPPGWGKGGGRRRRGRMRLMVRLMVKVGDGVKKDDGEA